jgi:hypothetical protein
MKDNNRILDGFEIMKSRSRSFYAENKAHIFTALGITGTIATGVLSARDGAKSARKIDRKAIELGRQLTTKEKIQLCWMDYWDAVLAGGISCFSTFKSDMINTDEISKRTALLIASEKAYEKLSQKTREVLGEKKTQQIRDEIAKETVHDGTTITQEKLDNAPRIGNGELYPFVDEYSKFLFWSNLDYIDLCVMKLNKMMEETEPRNIVSDYYGQKKGVPYSEWLAMVGADPKQYNTPERKNAGWSKGFAEDGSDDDPIAYFRTTEEYRPGFAVTVIKWEKDPTDMTLGRLIKSSGVTI